MQAVQLPQEQLKQHSPAPLCKQGLVGCHLGAPPKHEGSQHSLQLRHVLVGPGGQVRARVRHSSKPLLLFFCRELRVLILRVRAW